MTHLYDDEMENGWIAFKENTTTKVNPKSKNESTNRIEVLQSKIYPQLKILPSR